MEQSAIALLGTIAFCLHPCAWLHSRPSPRSFSLLGLALRPLRSCLEMPPGNLCHAGSRAWNFYTFCFRCGTVPFFRCLVPYSKLTTLKLTEFRRPVMNFLSRDVDSRGPQLKKSCLAQFALFGVRYIGLLDLSLTEWIPTEDAEPNSDGPRRTSPQGKLK